MEIASSMASLARLTIVNLLNTYAGLDSAIREDKTNSGFMISSLVIRHFLGIEWIEKNIYPDPKKSGIMRLDDPLTICARL